MRITPEVSADPIIQTHISMTETYTTLNETDIYPTFYRQEEHQKYLDQPSSQIK